MPDGNLECYHFGLDAGSTTVKAVLLNDAGDILFQDYQRHQGKQREYAEKLIDQVKQTFGQIPIKLYCTGSGGSALAKLFSGAFFQEVSAVSEAVCERFSDIGSVIELGGQDAKMLIYPDQEKGQSQKFFSMNDKCAGGTGAVIDKIAAKLSLTNEQLSKMPYDGVTIHPVAAKCGVFAETDVNGLQKSGVDEEQLIASLVDAIVLQNLNILTRGNTLRPKVLLLGGPNSYLSCLVQAWRHHIAALWKKRGVSLPANVSIEELVFVPDNALYFAALGAVALGKKQHKPAGFMQVAPEIIPIIETPVAPPSKSDNKPLFTEQDDFEAFKAQYAVPPFTPPAIETGKKLTGFLGLDCGSTSTKAALLDEEGKVIELCYKISQNNPILDTQSVLQQLEEKLIARNLDVTITRVVTTGYAKDMLLDVIGADDSVVETVAHTSAATHFYDDVDVICDVGGQDIKLIFLKNGNIKDFRLNTQCSAGNGYFLHNTVQGYGIAMEDYASIAIKAKKYPTFGYGCSVFMQSDIIDFQRQGWEVEEILAGLAAVLPSNIWLYVAAIPNLTTLGSTFLLQGGTQRNLAAVKAQVDFIQSRFLKADKQANVHVHKYCGESGAIGAALEGLKQYKESRAPVSRFIGFNGVAKLHYHITNDDRTICGLCDKNCRRSFIDVQSGLATLAPKVVGKVPLKDNHVRVITGNQCEKGLFESRDELKQVNQSFKQIERDYPNMADYCARKVWRHKSEIEHNPAMTRFGWLSKATPDRSHIKILVPRVLNMYALMPFFRAYFESLGITQIHFSEFTDEQMFKKGASRLSIDPCFPSKVALAHVNQLVEKYVGEQSDEKQRAIIFFPMIRTLPTQLNNTTGSYACPTVTMTPETVKAALTKENTDLFANQLKFHNPVLDFTSMTLLARQLYEDFQSVLSLNKRENTQAVKNAIKTLTRYKQHIQDSGKAIIDELVKSKRIGLVVLGRTYHNDPGLNHGIMSELQSLGYPVLTQDSLPMEDTSTTALFAKYGEDNPLAIDDIWDNAYSENTNQKLWAAKYVARHPNLVAVELSSFNCGHDAPIYDLITKIIETSGTPYFCFKDLDENKPSGSLKIRLETINYYLAEYQRKLQVERQVVDELSIPVEVIN